MKKETILIIYALVILTTIKAISIKIKSKEQTNDMLLNEIKTKVVDGFINKLIVDLVDLFDSNFDLLKSVNEANYQDFNVNNLPNKFLNKLHVSNNLYTKNLSTKNLRTENMKSKNIIFENLSSKIAKIDSENKSLILNDQIEFSQSQNKSNILQVIIF